MDELLSVRDARKLTGKSESTIKRMIREIATDPNHEDRGLIEPSPNELDEKKKNGEPYHWKISKSLLDKRYPTNDPDHAAGHATGQRRGESSVNDASQTQVIAILQEQLKILETQLNRKDKQIDDLNNRMEESHVLMQTLQKRLEIPIASQSDNVVDTQTNSVADATIIHERPASKRKTLKDIFTTPISFRR